MSNVSEEQKGVRIAGTEWARARKAADGSRTGAKCSAVVLGSRLPHSSVTSVSQCGRSYIRQGGKSCKSEALPGKLASCDHLLDTWAFSYD